MKDNIDLSISRQEAYLLLQALAALEQSEHLPLSSSARYEYYSQLMADTNDLAKKLRAAMKEHSN